MAFRPGQMVFLNIDTVPQIEKDFSIHPLVAGSLEVQRIIDISETCTCGCDEGIFFSHLPLCNITRIKEIGCNQLITVITGRGLIRTHPAIWFTSEQPNATP